MTERSPKDTTIPPAFSLPRGRELWYIWVIFHVKTYWVNTLNKLQGTSHLVLASYNRGARTGAVSSFFFVPLLASKS